MPELIVIAKTPITNMTSDSEKMGIFALLPSDNFPRKAKMATVAPPFIKNAVRNAFWPDEITDLNISRSDA